MGNEITKIWEWQKEIDENSFSNKCWKIFEYIKSEMFNLTNPQENTISSEEKKKNERIKSMSEIKWHLNFVEFFGLFDLVKEEYQKDKNKTIEDYIDNSGLSWYQKDLFLEIYRNIIEKVISKTTDFVKWPGMDNYDKMILEQQDAFFALWTKNFNL